MLSTYFYPSLIDYVCSTYCSEATGANDDRQSEVRSDAYSYQASDSVDASLQRLGHWWAW